MDIRNSTGVWPVMLTPFTPSGEIDYHALDQLIDWYLQNGVDGLFAVCQSSEMFFLSLRERLALAAHIKKRSAVPVIASGHISASPADQIQELRAMADTGADAVIMITNRQAEEGSNSICWLEGLDVLLDQLPKDLPLGLYECPYPFKHLVTDEELDYCAKSGRFYFLKDTCCDSDQIQRRLDIVDGTPLRLFNANTATLLESLRCGGAGFSGVMANFHPELYVWLCRHWRTEPQKAEKLQAALTFCSKIESQCYPLNAKIYLRTQGILMTEHCRVRNSLIPNLYRQEIEQLYTMSEWMGELIR